VNIDQKTARAEVSAASIQLLLASRGAVPAASATRRRIIAVATRMFATDGFTGASMRRIAEQCDIQAASIYGHFKDKQELLATVMIGAHSAWLGGAADLINPELEPLEQLHRLVDWHVTEQAESLDTAIAWDVLADAKLVEHHLSPEQVKEYWKVRNAYLDLMRSLVAASFPGDAVEARTSALLAICNRLPQWVADAPAGTADDARALAWRFALAVLGATKPA
jgi:TetR/AcrR family transcriptional regulator, cholesterol catabolism regulator